MALDSFKTIQMEISVFYENNKNKVFSKCTCNVGNVGKL
jgi:hypothetical protein